MFTFAQPLSRGRAALRGILATVLGVLCLAWPGISIGVAVALFAIYCFADAITQIGNLFRSRETVSHRMLAILLGLIDVAAGIVAIAYPGITAGALVIVIGAWAIVGGVTQLGTAWQARGAGSGWLTFNGVLSVIAGVLLIVWPDIGAVTLALVFGIYLMLYGVALLASASVTPRGGDVADAFA